MRQSVPSQQWGTASDGRISHTRLAAAALAGSGALYFVIVAVTKTDALEWFGMPWGRGDDVVVVQTHRSPGAAVRSQPTVVGRSVGVDRRKPRAAVEHAKRPGSSPSPASTKSGRTPDAGTRPATDSPGRTPATGVPASVRLPRSPASAGAQEPSSDQPSPSGAITLPPPLPPVQVDVPQLPVTPPEPPVTPPPLPVTTAPPPVTPPSLPSTPELTELPTLPTLP